LSRTSKPFFVADERTQLVGWLDLQRALVHYTCEGLSEQDAHRSVLPTSPLMTMAGLVSHLRWVEHCWFDAARAGPDDPVNPLCQVQALPATVATPLVARVVAEKDADPLDDGRRQDRT